MRAAWVVYVAGVLIALWRTDASAVTRVLLALLWPIGPLAFVIVVAILVGASVIAFPAFGAVLAALLVGTWWIWG